jgi:hypothetical protein
MSVGLLTALLLMVLPPQSGIAPSQSVESEQIQAPSLEADVALNDSLSEPVPSLYWQNASKQELALRVSGTDPSLQECLQSGLPLRYQYSVQLCERESAWFDSCGPQREIVKTVRYSPVAEQYAIESEGYLGSGDAYAIVSEVGEVVANLMSIQGIALSSLKEANQEESLGEPIIITDETVLKVRVVSICDGEVADVFAHVSYFLTMGMYRISGFNSGWVEVQLKSLASS